MDNRRKTFVINKKFQYQYSLLIAALTVLLVNGFLIVRMVLPGDPLALTSTMIWGVAAVELFLVVGIWYGSLRASHRIAGPVYVFARILEQMGNGDLSGTIDLRDSDMFRPEGLAMNDSIAALRGKIDTLKTLAHELQLAQTSGSDITVPLDKLASKLSGFNTGSDS